MIASHNHTKSTKLLLLIVLLLIQSNAFSQRILFKEKKLYNGCEVFGLYSAGAIQRSFCPLGINNNDFLPKMLKWASGSNGFIYGTNGSSLFRFDFNLQKTELLTDKINRIEELAVNDRYAYVVANNEAGKDGRSQKMYRVNLKNGKSEELKFTCEMNFNNLAISRDGNTLSFIRIENCESNLPEEQLCLFDLITEEMKVVDRAQKGELLGARKMYNSIVWLDSFKFLYYKHETGSSVGSIMYYDTSTKMKQKFFKNLKDDKLTWFSYCGQWLYYSDDNCLYKTKDGLKNEVICKRDIQEAVLVLK